jgi:chemotaxis protein methyltransferase CheR
MSQPIKTAKSSTLTEAELLQRAKNLLQQKAYNLATQQVERALELNSQNAYSHHLMAQIFIELGDFTRAIDYCRQAITIDRRSTEHYYLLVNILEKQGDIKQAEPILNKIICLDPHASVASIKLSRIYQQQGDKTQTTRMQELSLAALKQLPANQRIPELNNSTAAELMSELESKLTET